MRSAWTPGARRALAATLSVIPSLVVLAAGEGAAQAVGLGVELGVAESTPRQATVYSPLIALDFWVGRTRIDAELALTSIQAEGMDELRPSNASAGATYFSGDRSFFVGVAACVSFAAVAEGVEQNRLAASMRGYRDPWRWLPRTSSFIATWGVRGELGGGLRHGLTLDLATMFPSNGEPLTAPWQLAWDLDLSLVDGWIELGALFAVVRPTERFLGAGRGDFQLYVEPSITLDLGPLELAAAINVPVSGPLPSPLGDDGAEPSLLFGLRLGR